ncbi:MAG TPA: ATP-binding protein, partial [Polyangiaceae bacterium]|nr:ATP-binding protein [Polyangiaceae bacterium]
EERLEDTPQRVVGIPEDALRRIFEPFFTTKPVGKGTGLGLPTVLGIVKQCGGHVAVATEPSRGTTFRVYLPRSLEATTATRAAVAHDAAEDVPGGAETILLVEDEDQVRALVRRVLGRAGYTVLEASDADGALEAAAVPAPIHLLVTDSVLRKTTGRHVATHLGSDRPGLKVLYLSGGTGGSLDASGEPERGARTLRKPITPRGLLRAVRDLLDAP